MISITRQGKKYDMNALGQKCSSAFLSTVDKQ